MSAWIPVPVLRCSGGAASEVAAILAMALTKPIRLYWSGGRTGNINYGDVLSPFIVARLSGRQVVYASPHAADLAAIGSILHRACRKLLLRPLTLRSPLLVWGSGSLSNKPVGPQPWLDFRAVRGPLTRDIAKLPAQVPFGDPAILLPEFIDARAVGKRTAIAIVPHADDRDDPAVADLVARLPGADVIDLTDPDIEAVTRRIASAEMVLSSSLHGLVVADAYGVPALRLTFGDRIRGGEWKFDDYALGMNMKPRQPFRPHEITSTADAARCATVADRAVIRSRADDLRRTFAAMGF